jgi:MFS family permease
MVATSALTALGFIILPGSQEFGVGTSQFLIYYSCFSITSALSKGISGRLVARFGIKAVTFVGALISVVGFAAMALAPSLVMLYVVATILGLGWGACTTLSAAVIVNGWQAPKRRGSMMGIVMACTGIGGIMWGLVMPQAIAAGGWRGGLLTVGGMVAVLTLLPAIFLISNPPKPAADPIAAGNVASPAMVGTKKGPKKRNTVSLAEAGLLIPVSILMVSCVILSLESPVTQMLPSMFAISGIDKVQAGAMVSFFSFCLIFAKPAQGYIADRFGLKVSLIVAGCAYVIAFPGLALAQGTLQLGAALAVLALSVSTSTVVLPLVTNKVVGQDRFAAVYGIVLMMIPAAMAVGTPLWGLAYDMTGNYAVALFTAALAAVVALSGFAAAMAYARKTAAARAKNENPEPESAEAFI